MLLKRERMAETLLAILFLFVRNYSCEITIIIDTNPTATRMKIHDKIIESKCQESLF